MAVHQKALTGSSVVGPSALLYNYRYDQLNRLTAMDPYDGLNTGSPLTVRDQFRERIAYDANGNILKYLRHGHLSNSNLVMDSLSYKYYPNTNQLRRVVDSVHAGWYGNLSADLKDIDPQVDTSNYRYDAIGNLIKDSAERITSIKWTVYGKIKEINRDVTSSNSTTKIIYGYDPQGNRVSKIVERGTSSREYTYYVRDAQGNIMATYVASGTGSLETLNLQVSERHFYGSSRLGYYNHKVSVDVSGLGPTSMVKPASNKYSRGYRQYELSNHLGNVLTVLMDKRLGIDYTSDGQIDYYDAVVTSTNDYYPFGSMMPGRRFSSPNTYRYGFSGKEEDDEVKGDGNQQDYGERIFDSRVGRFLSVDPLTKTYPALTPYQFASNTPVAAIDIDGEEAGIPLNGIGWSGSPMSTHFDNAEGRKVWMKGMGTGMAVGGAVVTDVFLTKGWMTRTLLASQVFGAFGHNRASTSEGRVAQQEKSKEALADAFITWGAGKVLGVSINTTSEIIRLAINRSTFAKNFYLSVGYSNADALKEIRGIEMTEKVFETTLKKGTVVEQWLKVDKNGKIIPGNYYTLPGADPTKLGISLEGRVKVQSTLDQDTKFLKSTSADIIDNWTTPGEAVSAKGGETQLFQTKVKTTPIQQ